MGRPGLRPLTGRGPAPTDSEGFSEPTPTTDRAVNAIGSVPHGRLMDNAMIDPRVVQTVTRAATRCGNDQLGRAPARPTARYTADHDSRIDPQIDEERRGHTRSTITTTSSTVP
jgi:hypothetical protein